MTDCGYYLLSSSLAGSVWPWVPACPAALPLRSLEAVGSGGLVETQGEGQCLEAETGTSGSTPHICVCEPSGWSQWEAAGDRSPLQFRLHVPWFTNGAGLKFRAGSRVR